MAFITVSDWDGMGGKVNWGRLVGDIDDLASNGASATSPVPTRDTLSCTSSERHCGEGGQSKSNSTIVAPKNGAHKVSCKLNMPIECELSSCGYIVGINVFMLT